MTTRRPKQGDTVKIVSYFTDKDTGVAISLSGYIFNSVMKSSTREYVITTDSSQASLGILTHVIATAAMEVDTYLWDIRMTKSGESFSTPTVEIIVGEGIS